MPTPHGNVLIFTIFVFRGMTLSAAPYSPHARRLLWRRWETTMAEAYVMKADAVMSVDGDTHGAKQDVSARNLGPCPSDVMPGAVLVLIDGRWQAPPAG